MSRTLRSLALVPLVALACSALAPLSAAAQSSPGFKQIFISPSGEPFRAKADEPFPVSQWFKGADTDHDGALSLAEFKADAARFFKDLDKDGDGMITGPENQFYERQVAPEILFDAMLLAQTAPPSPTYERGPLGEPPQVQGGGTRIGQQKAPRKQTVLDVRRGAGQFSFLNEPQPIRTADANLDYKVSADEWAKTAVRRFNTLDVNHDGKLTPDELPPTPFQQMLTKRK